MPSRMLKREFLFLFYPLPLVPSSPLPSTPLSQEIQNSYISIPFAALSIEGQLLGTIMDESEIDYLVTEIEQHEHLMEDNAFGEQLRT